MLGLVYPTNIREARGYLIFLYNVDASDTLSTRDMVTHKIDMP
jgi:hypothetical protein